MLAGLLSVLASGLTLLGSSPTPLPFWKTMAVQLAAAFTGRTTAAAIGFYGINIAFLERVGLRRGQAVGVMFVNRVPVRSGQLFGGAVLFIVLQGVGLAATLAAFDQSFDLVAVLAVYVVGATLGQLAPTPVDWAPWRRRPSPA